MIKILHSFREEPKIISTNKGDKKVMVIRRGPRGLVSMVLDLGIIVIYPNDIADEHIDDSEESLLEALIEKINSLEN
jgi:hypothetical protein